MTFAQLGLAEPLVRALEAKGYTTPTPIQKQSIPILLEGGDLLGIAQTGTGKTAAFVLPSIQQLVNNEKRVLPTHCRMLVLAPTRELASQIAESAREYGKFSKMSVATVFGGTSINKNRQDMARGVDILVATPGRLLDLIEQRFVSLAMLEILVLDEADQMLDLGFIHALRKIVRMLPKQRQTLFFSATMPNAIRELANQFLNDPKTVKVAPTSSTAERVDQFVTFLNQGEKQALLTILLRDEKVERALVFTRTKHGADRVVKLLGANGIVSNAIHGNKSQPQRERALAEFKSGKAKVLVATDIAARGIDVSGVSHVFNFELPNVPEQYVHRIGRTARAGASGTAISFVADDERTYLRDIEKLTRVKPEMMQLPEGFTAEAARIKAARPAGSDTFERRDDSGRHRAPPKATHAARPTGDRPAGAGRPAGARPEGAGRPAGGGRPGGQGRPGGGFDRPGGGRSGGQGRPAGGGGGRRSPAAG
ncbi:DEAD/DEAH box helicase [Sphingomonas echinoides]|uniref:DEAD/DEAH box helicase n=2 Tax=Pseudomonadota TaxID=1224 RepID=A0ABU4PPI5_9SPHN|nr:DEAD/DEAH box helicase [Sphingomonas echinoides]MDX5986056.1 DEAD/DEAH box helicase [Sphingomonas echinoides]